jgi:hypothetical protein
MIFYIRVGNPLGAYPCYLFWLRREPQPNGSGLSRLGMGSK